ncbi:MAG: glycosyltransferase family 4 protein [Sphaerospermopsis sp.]|nr:glycosyltransferase family 4 protein [Sphaerospermopsis sp.]
MASTKPKLILVISSLGGGGAERVMSDMANYWATKGWHITLVTLNGPRETDTDKYSLHPSINREYVYYPPGINFIDKLWRNLQRVIQLRTVVKKVAPDAVLSFLTSTNVVTILATRGVSIPVIVSERINPARHVEKPMWNYGRWLTYRLAHRVVAQTPTIGQWLVKHTQAPIAIIPNPLRELPTLISNREKLIVGAGRLHPEKGFDVLIRAFASTGEAVNGWKLVIVGEGSQRKALIELIQELELGDSVTLVGWTNNVETWFARASLVVQPSRYEGFPNAVLEAMAMGATVVSTSAADCLIVDGVNGRLVGVDDVDHTARVMLQLMNDEQQRQGLGSAAQKVRTTYAQAAIIPQWESVMLHTNHCSNIKSPVHSHDTTIN